MAPSFSSVANTENPSAIAIVTVQMVIHIRLTSLYNRSAFFGSEILSVRIAELHQRINAKLFLQVSRSYNCTQAMEALPNCADEKSGEGGTTVPSFNPR